MSTPETNPRGWIYAWAHAISAEADRLRLDKPESNKEHADALDLEAALLIIIADLSAQAQQRVTLAALATHLPDLAPTEPM